jgi:6-pyruvoyltetrahydropterin/6-carboxytetrahydropterin synthase
MASESLTPTTFVPSALNCGEPCSFKDTQLVALNHVNAVSWERLVALCKEAGCLPHRAALGHESVVLAGSPDALAALRGTLLTEPGLRSVREAVEARLAELAHFDPVSRGREETHKRTTVATEQKVPVGTTLLVSREFTFDAAHNLPRYHGKCEKLHGHTFRVRVTVKAPLDTFSGMAFDFHQLKGPVEARVVKVLDHTYINETIANPSAEFMAVWIWEQLADLPLHEVMVWETPTCFVTYHGPARSDARS